MARFTPIRVSILSLGFVAAALMPGATQAQEGGAYAGLVSTHAATHGLPPSLVHRVIMRESRYNPRAVSKGNYGMMQIRLGTARAMGYRGDASGLLDPNINMTYAVKYLAGAYRAAGGNHDRAVALYARGYHDVAKRQGTSAVALANGGASTVLPAIAPVAPIAQPQVRQAYNADYSASRRSNDPAGMVTTSRDQDRIW